MHYIVAMDTLEMMHLNFIRWLQARKYKGNKSLWGVKVREIKIYDLVFPEEIEGQVKADLKFFQSSEAGTMMEIPKIVKIVSKILGLKYKKLKPLSFDDVESTPFVDMNLPHYPYDFYAGIAPLAKLEDGHEEIVPNQLTELL